LPNNDYKRVSLETIKTNWEPIPTEKSDFWALMIEKRINKAGKSYLYHFQKTTRQMGRGTAPVRYLICQKIVDAVPLQRVYLSQTLFELV
jgi:hypothetical protein